MSVGKNAVKLALWDTIGLGAYDRLRPLAYAKVNVFVLVFSMVDRISFENIRKLWFPEVHRYGPEVPIVLAGTKLDLTCIDSETLIGMEESGSPPVTFEEGIALAKEINAVAFIPFSSYTHTNLQFLFDEAVSAALISGVDPPVLFASDQRCVVN
eukprot:TRINITY_DN4662_c0_g1_i2.p1 TRINITY_DN4662_c0_g1~~TRINITY_DN4662_c0_g1_i2.p1  ORF type:complete len:155 (+),score=29.56 TRINITY_DN4662_c0_g1_i2:3-467(+)